MNKEVQIRTRIVIVSGSENGVRPGKSLAHMQQFWVTPSMYHWKLKIRLNTVRIAYNVMISSPFLIKLPIRVSRDHSSYDKVLHSRDAPKYIIAFNVIVTSQEIIKSSRNTKFRSLFDHKIVWNFILHSLCILHIFLLIGHIVCGSLSKFRIKKGELWWIETIARLCR